MRVIILVILLQGLVGCDEDKPKPVTSNTNGSGPAIESGRFDLEQIELALGPDPKKPGTTEPKPQDTPQPNDREAPSMPLENWDCSYAEKKWDVKLKSVEPYWTIAYKLLFEFTKDVEDKQGLREAFPRREDNRSPKAVWYFFDEDNVVIAKAFQDSIEGELTGVKGDAFRVILIPTQDKRKLVKIRKAAIRAFE